MTQPKTINKEWKPIAAGHYPPGQFPTPLITDTKPTKLNFRKLIGELDGLICYSTPGHVSKWRINPQGTLTIEGEYVYFRDKRNKLEGIYGYANPNIIRNRSKQHRSDAVWFDGHRVPYTTNPWSSLKPLEGNHDYNEVIHTGLDIVQFLNDCPHTVIDSHLPVDVTPDYFLDDQCRLTHGFKVIHPYTGMWHGAWWIRDPYAFHPEAEVEMMRHRLAIAQYKNKRLHRILFKQHKVQLQGGHFVFNQDAEWKIGNRSVPLYARYMDGNTRKHVNYITYNDDTWRSLELFTKKPDSSLLSSDVNFEHTADKSNIRTYNPVISYESQIGVTDTFMNDNLPDDPKHFGYSDHVEQHGVGEVHLKLLVPGKMDTSRPYWWKETNSSPSSRLYTSASIRFDNSRLSLGREANYRTLNEYPFILSNGVVDNQGFEYGVGDGQGNLNQLVDFYSCYLDDRTLHAPHYTERNVLHPCSPYINYQSFGSDRNMFGEGAFKLPRAHCTELANQFLLNINGGDVIYPATPVTDHLRGDCEWPTEYQHVHRPLSYMDHHKYVMHKDRDPYLNKFHPIIPINNGKISDGVIVGEVLIYYNNQYHLIPEGTILGISGDDTKNYWYLDTIDTVIQPCPYVIYPSLAKRLRRHHFPLRAKTPWGEHIPHDNVLKRLYAFTDAIWVTDMFKTTIDDISWLNNTAPFTFETVDNQGHKRYDRITLRSGFVVYRLDMKATFVVREPITVNFPIDLDALSAHDKVSVVAGDIPAAGSLQPGHRPMGDRCITRIADYIDKDMTYKVVPNMF